MTTRTLLCIIYVCIKWSLSSEIRRTETVEILHDMMVPVIGTPRGEIDRPVCRECFTVRSVKWQSVMKMLAWSPNDYSWVRISPDESHCVKKNKSCASRSTIDLGCNP